MPVTRSSSRPSSQRPSSPAYTSRRAGPSASRDPKKSSHPPSNSEIIVLSSDDDEPRSKGNAPKKSSQRLPRRNAGTSAVVSAGDVLEISSDEETRPKRVSPRKHAPTSETTIKDLQCTVKKLKEELKQSEQQLASTFREVEELKLDCSNKDVLSGLEEYTACEVCTLTMWCPYILPECGHSFCENCLVNWFSKTQAQHMTANPQLDNSRAALSGQLQAFVQLVPNLHAYGQHGQLHIRAVLAELRRHRPEYTCPSCRKEVLNKPIEDFRLKGFIKEIAERVGEKDSFKDTFRYQASGPFDHFFAAPISAR